ncbi:hypothetical protein J6590_101515 [Homalodisca vitripennis]|nr:hypothetical protein J6590_101515 [Homalodisca vitripennis]
MALMFTAQGKNNKRVPDETHEVQTEDNKPERRAQTGHTLNNSARQSMSAFPVSAYIAEYDKREPGGDGGN